MTGGLAELLEVGRVQGCEECANVASPSIVLKLVQRNLLMPFKIAGFMNLSLQNVIVLAANSVQMKGVE